MRTQPHAAAARRPSRSADGLQDYLQLMARIPLLTPAEEVHLGGIVQRWLSHPDPPTALRRSGARARNRMVSANLRLVVMMCGRYRDRIDHLQLEMLDLLQAGNLGLIRAVEKFNPSRGYRFSTYACWWIHQSVQRFIHGFGNSIRIPSQMQTLAFRARLLQAGSPLALSSQAMAESLGEEARRLEMSLQVVSQCRPLSLDQPLAGGDGDSGLLNRIADEHTLNPEEDYHWLHDHVRRLGTPERRLLVLRYGSNECRSLSEAARMMGFSKSTVRCLERRALRTLRQRLGGALPQPGVRRA